VYGCARRGCCLLIFDLLARAPSSAAQGGGHDGVLTSIRNLISGTHGTARNRADAPATAPVVPGAMSVTQTLQVSGSCTHLSS
jgi:hypothetical protein